MADVASVNLQRRFACLDDGRTLPITNLLDADGEETTVDAAVGFVCGEAGEWYAGLLSAFEKVTLQ